MKQRWTGIIALCLLAAGSAKGADSTAAAKGGNPVMESSDTLMAIEADTNKTLLAPGNDSTELPAPRGGRHAAIAAALAAVVPGAGLFYTREYVRGGLVIAAGGVLAIEIASNESLARGHQASLNRELDYARASTDSIAFDTVTFNGILDTTDVRYASTLHLLRADTARFERDKNRMTEYQAATWLAGTYLYSILKAVDMTGRFKTDKPKNPVVAGWLSAIPFLGLGQIYNGSLAKAGVVWMTQTSLASIALTNNMLMLDAQNHLSSILSYSDWEVQPSDKGIFQSQWNGYRSKAFTDRNTYLWYFLLFYFYGIFDAVVDAHLHDYPARMRLEPDLEPHAGGGVQVNLKYSF